MKHTLIQISQLKPGRHQFQFRLGEKFLDDFSTLIFQKPNIEVKIDLNISEYLIEADLQLNGKIELECDRSMETFSQAVQLHAKHFFKFGEEEEELSDEIEVIHKDRAFIDFDQLVYDTIALSLPAKKLHPKFQEGEVASEEEGQIIYRSEDLSERTFSEEPTSGTDPRWNKLKELNSTN